MEKQQFRVLFNNETQFTYVSAFDKKEAAILAQAERIKEGKQYNIAKIETIENTPLFIVETGTFKYIVETSGTTIIRHPGFNDRISYDPAMFAIIKYARELQQRLEKARAEIERLRQELRDNSTLAARQIVPAEMLVDDLTAEIERKDAIIEQMREALKLVDSVPLVFPKWFDGDDISVWDVVKAALSAAERGEG